MKKEEVVEQGVHNYSAAEEYVWPADEKVMKKLEYLLKQGFQGKSALIIFLLVILKMLCNGVLNLILKYLLPKVQVFVTAALPI